MKLRSQLLLITALVLVLPLAGWQFVTTLEQSLRNAHERAMIDTATTIARTLATEQAQLWPAAEGGMYVHPTNQTIHLDGHDGEWQAWLDQAQGLEPASDHLDATLLASRNRSGLHLLLRVEDPSLVFADPGQGPGDHVELSIVDGNRSDTVTLAPLAPGWIETSGERGMVRVQGNWQPRSRGWTLELQVLEPASPDRLGISVHDVDDPVGRDIRDSATTGGIRPLITPVDGIAQHLSRLLPDNTRAWATTPEGWVLARDDRRGQALEFSPGEEDRPGWLGTVLFERLISGRLPVREDLDAYTPRLSGPEISRSPSATWVASDEGPGIAVIASAPVEVDGQRRGLVVIERDADELLMLANQAVLNLFGSSLAGMALIALILLGFAALLSERIRRLRNAAEQAVAPDGRVREPITPSRAGDEIGDLGRSMAELMARQQTHQDYLRTLADKLSHELRTPLAMIRSSLDNLAQVEDAQDRERYRQRAEEGCRRLGHILQGMSQAARVEESLHDEPLESIDLAELVDGYIAGCRTAYPTRRFSVERPASGTARVHGAEELLAQLLDKLVENAVDFSPENGNITMQVMRRKDEVILQVDNPGPPLPENIANRLFDSMVSVRPGGGTDVHMGLGLYVARLIVDHHGGRIHAVNRPGGCRFQVRLPSA